MAIKKIISGGGDIDITHGCAVQQIQGQSVAVIFDKNKFHKDVYESMSEKSDIETCFSPRIIKSTKGYVFIAIIRLRTKDEFLEFTIQPSIEFIDLFRNKKSLLFLIEEIHYGFGCAELYTEDFDEMYDKYIELKREENN